MRPLPAPPAANAAAVTPAGRRTHLVVVGATGATTPLELFEQLAVAPQDLPTALHHLHAHPAIVEVAILSTCNRVELYAAVTSPQGGLDAMQAFLRARAHQDAASLTPSLHASGVDAVRHLFAVASGLRSLVVGERQITGQLRTAIAASAEAGCCGPQLHALFRAALTSSRRIRRETGISDTASSVAEVALRAATDTLGGLTGRTVLLIGAGTMGNLVAKLLHGQVGHLTVTNRTPEPARRLAERTSAATLPWHHRASGVAAADLVVCSTAAPAPVLDRQQLAAAVAGRPGRPLVVLDLAVPRAVSPDTGDLPTVVHLDVDSIRASMVRARADDAVRTAEDLVRRDAARFAREVAPPEVTTAITALRARGERVRAEELARGQRQLDGLEPADREMVERLTRRIVQRLLHEPSIHLRQATACPHDALEHARVVTEMFEL